MRKETEILVEGTLKHSLRPRVNYVKVSKIINRKNNQRMFHGVGMGLNKV